MVEVIKVSDCTSNIGDYDVPIHNAIIIPQNATNGEMIQALFPDAEFDNAKPFTDGRWETMNLDTEDSTRALYKPTQLRTYADWWDAKYKGYSEEKIKEMIMKRIENVLDEMKIKYEYHKEKNNEEWYGLVEFWTDCSGQDIPTEFNFDGTAEDFVKQFTEAADNYDVDDQVEIYVNMRGKNGVPNTVREILNDCQEAKDTLMEIAEKLKEAIEE